MIENHRPLLVTASWESEASADVTLPCYNQRKFVLSKANWALFEEILLKRFGKLKLQCESAAELDILCQGVQNAIFHATKKAMPRSGNSSKYRPPYVTESVVLLQKRMYRSLRFWLRRKTSRTRRAAFMEARRIYDAELEKAKKSSWIDFCSTITDSDPFCKAFKVLAGKLKRNLPLMPVFRRSDSALVDTPKEIVEALVAEYFPAAESAHSVDLLVATESVAHDDVPFTPFEVERAISSLKPRKAPGYDMLPSEVIQRAYACRPELFNKLLNDCLTYGCFPKVWKKSVLRIIPKAGRTKPEASSFRPICLLPTMGKVLDYLMIDRINYDLNSRDLLSDRQHGFREGVSTGTAIRRLIDFVKVSQSGPPKQRQISMALSLDIEGAFNSASWAEILGALKRYHAPKNLLKLAESYFHERVVEYRSQAVDFSKEVFRGCPQGSVSGPASGTSC